MFRSDQGAAMDNSTDVPADSTAFDIVDDGVDDPSTAAAAELEKPRSAVSAWHQALALQSTEVTEVWVTSVTHPRHRI